MTSLVGSLLGVLVGASVTWLVAHLYYVKASKELQIEANKLFMLTSLIHQGLEEAGLAKFTKDQYGNIIGMKYHLAGHTKITLTSEAGMSHNQPHRGFNS